MPGKNGCVRNSILIFWFDFKNEKKFKKKLIFGHVGRNNCRFEWVTSTRALAYFKAFPPPQIWYGGSQRTEDTVEVKKKEVDKIIFFPLYTHSSYCIKPNLILGLSSPFCQHGRPTPVLANSVQITKSCLVQVDLRNKLDGRPKHNLKKETEKKLKEINTPTYANFPLQKSYFISSPILDKLICNFCKCIPNKPVDLLTCRHLCVCLVSYRFMKMDLSHVCVIIRL